MKIQSITSIKFNNNQQYHIQNTVSKTPQSLQNGVYNPVYYNDYNLKISFGKRSPEDFYAQDFNKNNMPETMKNYLNAKFEERSKIAPVQIMQEAFDRLNGANSVDEIKKRFPEEQKFAKLRPANYSGATTGLLKKIKDLKAMQETPEPLFKNGCDDLTTYLVKKIYLEGKTVKEIDKDFAKDINEVYELAARIPSDTRRTLGKNESAYFSHSTIYNLGIRFPEVPFWNSFIATRDDYERTKRVKSLTGEFVNADSAEGKAAIQHHQKQHAAKSEPNKYNFKREKIKNISDTIVNYNGDSRKALREVKHRSKSNLEELTFIQKYWGQIMTLATEKVHLSEEMIAFNQSRRTSQDRISGNLLDKLITGEDLTKREKTPFKAFWSENPWLKSEFSTAITDSIMQFTDAYGADGNNSYFKALLQDIENIKPNREKAKLLHAQIQAEYDELARSLQPKQETTVLEETVKEVKDFVDDIKEPEFKYHIGGHEIVVPFNLKSHAYQVYQNDFTMIPRKLFDTYMRELETLIKDDPERFYLSCCFEVSPDTPDINEVLYSDKEMYKYNDDLIGLMETKHNSELESCRLSLLEYADRHGLITPEEVRTFANEDILRIRDNLHAKVLKTGEVTNAHNEIQDLFAEIHKPLSNKEKIGIRHKLMSFLKNYNMAESSSKGTSVPSMIKLLSLGAEKHAPYASVVKTLLNDEAIFNFEGPSLRYMLKENGNKAIKTLLGEHTFKSLIYLYPGDSSVIVTSNPREFVRLMADFPTELEAVYTLSKKVIAKTAGYLK